MKIADLYANTGLSDTEITRCLEVCKQRGMTEDAAVRYITRCNKMQLDGADIDTYTIVKQILDSDWGTMFDD